uniref:Drebrin n=1 Tax=Oncorhynchus mykiss TaxID=8022 RepID=A0A8K9V8W9_ONCMY
MGAINLDTYSLSLLTAKEDILNPRSSTNWALFTYDGATNNLKLADSGAGGVVELSEKFLIARPQYGLCRVGSAEVGGPPVAMICWVGPNVDENRRTECASHVPAIKTFFKEAYVFISAESKEDVTEEKIGAELSKVRSPTEHVRRISRSKDKETVGTNYRKTNAAMEMSRANRDSFWARAEREEERRKEEERKRAVEDRRRWEKERVWKEQKEADERERKMNEKLQMIEEMQVQLEAEVRKQEKSRWELQEREHEEDMRFRFRRSESIEKAAEAAMLVSQRSMNPREFFRQLSSVSSHSPSSPGSPRTVKPPLRRYQRSLTDTAFNFGKSDSPTPTSPRSPTLVSRFPTSPFHRTMSPPSPIFRPITSPQSPRVPLVSPPKSALHSSPPVSAQATLPSPSLQSQLQTQPSALPASPGLLTNMSLTSPLENQLQAQFLAALKTTLVIISLPEQYTAVQVVLVEEEEDEEEDQAEPEPSIESTEPNPNMEEGGEGSAQDSDLTSVQEPMAEEGEEAKEAGQEKGQSDYSQVSAEPFLVELSEEEQEPAVTGILCTLPVKSLDTPTHSRDFLYLYYFLHWAIHDCFSLFQTCVRALYDYQAEDESEISFEPGDIISAVETVDKAWWQGCTKDGRQGLFPANYVETI